MGDQEIGTIGQQFAHGRADVTVAETFGDDDFDAGCLSGSLGRIDALLVPAEVTSLFRSKNGYGIYLGGEGRGC